MANSSVRRFLGDSSSRFLLFPALLFVGATLLSGCHPAASVVSDPKDPKFVVAEKGTLQITRADLDTEIASFLKQHNATADQVGPAKMPMVETMMLKNMVLKKLLLQQAATLDLKDVDKEEAAQLEAVKQSVPPGQDFDSQLKASGMSLDDLKAKIHEQVVIHKVLETEVKNVDPTDQQIEAIYLKYKDNFNIPAKIRASRVLVLVDDKTSAADKVAKKKAIDAARARVMKGEDFSKVAMEVSEDQYSKPKGGDLGLFAKGENPDQGFDDVAFNAKLNVVSPVFQTAFGYQFLKVTEIHPAGVVPIAQARELITNKLKEQNMEMQSQAYAKKLLTDANVTYHIVLVDPPAPQMAPQGASPDGGDAGGPPPQAPPDSAQPGAAPQAPPAEAPPASAPAPAPGAPSQ